MSLWRKSLQSLGIVAIASQNRNVQGQALAVSRYCQDDLRTIGPMVPAVPVLSQVLRPLAFEINTGQIIENQTDRLREATLVELLLQTHPVAIELIHRGINIVLIKGLLRVQSTGLRQPGAPGFVSQRQLGAGKEQAAEKGGLEQSTKSRRADVRKEFSQTKACPGFIKHSQTTVVQSLLQLNQVGGKEALPFERADDKLAGVGRQVSDITDGPGARATGSAESFAHQIGNVGLAILPSGFGGLHEHGLHTNCIGSWRQGVF